MQLALTNDIQLPEEHGPAVERVTAALKEQGFGVLTAIDIKAAFKEKIGADFRPYTILGACNPPLAHRALTTEPLVGLMLPCNVTVEAAPGGGSLVRFLNPDAMLGIEDLGKHPAMGEVAKDASARLTRVAEALRRK
jgi:uncharacterized protein (DUF302 family)